MAELKRSAEAMKKKKFEERLVDAALIGLISSGSINPRRKDRAGLLRAAHRYLKNAKVQWRIVGDHKTRLLTQAESLVQDGNKELALVLYATLIEHALNFVIHHKSESLRLPSNQVEALFKDTQIRAKFIWVHILCGRRVPKEEYDRVCLVNSLRNEFVHYKWKETDEKHDSRVSGAASAAELSSRYLKDFIRKHVYRGFDGFEKERAKKNSFRFEVRQK